jgi:hypothetical protein
MTETLELTFSAPTVTANAASRTITGQIVPFGVPGNTSAGKVVFLAGSIADFQPENLKLIVQHDMTRPVGRGVSAQHTPSGITMSFKIANTSTGNDMLVEASDGLRDGLSVGAAIDKFTNKDGVMMVSAARLIEVSLVTDPAFTDARVSDVAASETPETPDGETAPEETTTEEETMSDVQSDVVAEDVTASAVPVQAAAPVAFTQPRSPIVTGGDYLKHSIRAQYLNDAESAGYVAHADAQARVNAANDSFTTNPAFKPVQYVSNVIDPLIGSRPAIDAIGVQRLADTGMVVSYPKITTSSTVAVTAEGAAPSMTGIVSAYVNLDVKKYSGRQIYSLEVLERSGPDFYNAMYRNLQKAYAKATDAAVIAELTASGTQGATCAATSAGIISFVSVEAPAAYLATGEVANAYIAGTGQWSLLMGAVDGSNRPIYSASQPQNAGGSTSPTSLRGNVLGLDLWVDPNAVSTVIDESAFIVSPGSVAILEAPSMTLSSNAVATGEIDLSLNGFMAVGVLVAGGVRRFNLT